MVRSRDWKGGRRKGRKPELRDGQMRVVCERAKQVKLIPL